MFSSPHQTPFSGERVLFLASANSPGFPAFLERFEAISALSSAGKLKLQPKLVVAAGDGAAAQFAGLRESELLTRLSGARVLSGGGGVFVAAVGEKPVVAHGKALFEGVQQKNQVGNFAFTSGTPLFSSPQANLRIEQEVLARVGGSLVSHANYSALVCCGWSAFEAGARLKRESGGRAILSLDTHAEGMASSSSLAHADGVLVSDSRFLRALAESNPRHLAAKANELLDALHAISLARERHALSRIASSAAAPLHERRQAIEFLKQADASLAASSRSHGFYHFRSQHFAVLPHALSHHAPLTAGREEIAVAKRKLLGARSIDGSKPLAGKKLVYAIAPFPEDSRKLIQALSLLPQEIGIAFSGDSAGVAEAASEIGVGERVAVAENAGALASGIGASASASSQELLMLACNAIALPRPSPASFSQALRACSLAHSLELKAGPVLLSGECFAHSLEENALLSPSLSREKLASLLHAGVSDGEFRSRLAASALQAAGHEWSGLKMAREFEAFLFGT